MYVMHSQCKMNLDSDSEDLINEIRGKMIVHWNYRGLTELPDAIRACANDIREIYLKENKLTKLPQWMTELVNVTHLYLHGNSLHKVPLELISMEHLTLLDLSENGLDNLPGCIGDLKSLEFLTVDYNYLKKLPPELQRLKNLQSLSICNNEFVVLPEWLGSFSKLEQLRADNNSLEEMPNRLTLASGLCIISVCSNRLSYLPLNGFVSCPSIYFHSNPYLNYLSYPIFRQLLGNLGNSGIALGKFHSCKSSVNTNLKISLSNQEDQDIIVVLPRQLLKVHNVDVNTPASLWELSLRRIYCDRDKKMENEHQDRVSPVSYNLLVNGPIATCVNDNCREAIFTEAWIIAAKSQDDSLLDPVPIVALYCSQNCVLHFDPLSTGLDSVRWDLVQK